MQYFTVEQNVDQNNITLWIEYDENSSQSLAQAMCDATSSKIIQMHSLANKYWAKILHFDAQNLLFASIYAEQLALENVYFTIF